MFAGRSFLLPPEFGHERLENASFGLARIGSARKHGGEIDEGLRSFAVWFDFGDHLPIVSRAAEQLRVVRNDRYWIGLNRLGEFGGGDLRPLEHADAVQHQTRRRVVQARALHVVDQIFRVAEIGEVRACDDDDVVGGDENPSRPARPKMRHVDHNPGRRAAHGVEQRVRTRPRQSRARDRAWRAQPRG